MFELNQIPFFQEIENSQNILIAGAGGGFDIYSGIPLYLSLIKQGKNVFLGNLSFTVLSKYNAENECENCWSISATPDEDMISYFPEKHLAIWLDNNGLKPPIYAFAKTGVKPLIKTYEHLIKKHKIDTVILIDGGTDSLMFGDEPGLGTPTEDMTSIAALSSINLKKKYLVCIGFGVDYHHGVEHYYYLRNVAKLTKENAFLGIFSLLSQMKEAELFEKLIDYSNNEMPISPSIVANSINSAVNGEFGNFHSVYRTKGSELWINPLMSMYWCFNLEIVAKNVLYIDTLYETMKIEEVLKEIEQYRHSIKINESKKIPI
ncbi:MAG: DUF1152 domain-containing protein [Bacteroidales bacterium]|nr:DUF1152 domain-containing protein [Bacteroidales bacterium]